MLSLGLCAAHANIAWAEPPAKVDETVSGWSFRAIEAANAELKRHGLNIDDYQIFVFRKDTFLVVLFGSRAADADFFKIGCAGPRPCLTVLSGYSFRLRYPEPVSGSRPRSCRRLQGYARLDRTGPICGRCRWLGDVPQVEPMAPHQSRRCPLLVRKQLLEHDRRHIVHLAVLAVRRQHRVDQV
jgi:hypothetical protein